MPSHVLPCQRFFRDARSARKKRLPKISCNPLISIDSDERIQGNPSFSNPHNRSFRSEPGAIQENPNRLDRWKVGPPPSRSPIPFISMENYLLEVLRALRFDAGIATARRPRADGRHRQGRWFENGERRQVRRGTA